MATLKLLKFEQATAECERRYFCGRIATFAVANAPGAGTACNRVRRLRVQRVG